MSAPSRRGRRRPCRDADRATNLRDMRRRVDGPRETAQTPMRTIKRTGFDQGSKSLMTGPPIAPVPRQDAVARMNPSCLRSVFSVKCVAPWTCSAFDGDLIPPEDNSRPYRKRCIWASERSRPGTLRLRPSAFSR